ANDRATDVADVHLRLDAGESSRHPAEQRLIEGHRAPVVGAPVRDVIEPQRLPARRLKRCCRRDFSVCRALPSTCLRAVGDLNIEAVRILDVKALKISDVIGDRLETAFLELGLYLVRVPRLDTPCQVAYTTGWL